MIEHDQPIDEQDDEIGKPELIACLQLDRLAMRPELVAEVADSSSYEGKLLDRTRELHGCSR